LIRNLRTEHRRAASFIAKILRGVKPADLPLEQVVQFEFVVNLKAAKAISVTLPTSILLGAGWNADTEAPRGCLLPAKHRLLVAAMLVIRRRNGYFVGDTLGKSSRWRAKGAAPRTWVSDKKPPCGGLSNRNGD